MTEWKLFDGPPPEFTTAGWYEGRERAPHLEQEDHRDRLLLAAAHAMTLIGHLGLASAVDLGCGDGGLLTLLPAGNGLKRWGYDLCPAAVAGARVDRHVEVMYADVVARPDLVSWGELALATEFFEHLADPHAFAREIGRHCRAVVASSPARETPAEHYEFHAWAWDMDGYRALIEQAGFRVTRHALAGAYQVISGVRE